MTLPDMFLDLVDRLDGCGERMPIERRGDRQPICVHVRELVYRRDQGRCQLCTFTRGHSVRFEIDHVIPWSANGGDCTHNLELLCQRCNEIKSNRRTLLPLRPSIVTACSHCNPAVDVGTARAWCARCNRRTTVTVEFTQRMDAWLLGHCGISSWNDTRRWKPGKRPSNHLINEWLHLLYTQNDERIAALPGDPETILSYPPCEGCHFAELATWPKS